MSPKTTDAQQANLMLEVSIQIPGNSVDFVNIVENEKNVKRNISMELISNGDRRAAVY